MKKFRLAIACAAVILAQAAPATAQSGPMENVDGSSSFVGVRGVSVPAVDRTQTTQLVDAGTIDTDGYAKIVLNIAGRAAAESGLARGGVGAILVPDLEPYTTAFRAHGLLPSAVEIAAPADAATGTFMAKQVTFDVGFPRYRVLFFNTTGRPATVNFFAFRHRL